MVLFSKHVRGLKKQKNKKKLHYNLNPNWKCSKSFILSLQVGRTLDVGELLKVLKNVSTCFQFQLENLLGILLHCDKSICRPGNIPCHSWEYYQLLQENVCPPHYPAIAWTFQTTAGNCPSFVLPAIAGIFQMAKTWGFSQLFIMEEKSLHACMNLRTVSL